MIKNYLTITLRNIRRQRGYAISNIAGLAISIAIVTLILLYVQYELSFDRYHKKANQIYRVAQEFPYFYQGKNQAAITPAPLAPALTKEYAEVISATRLSRFDEVLLSYGEKSFLKTNFYLADPEEFEIFSFKLVKGSPKTALDEPNSIILSERMAEKYFGNDEPLGKVINFKDKNDFKVTGVLTNIPHNSHFIMDFVVPFDSYKSLTGKDYQKWYISAFYTYLLVREGTDPLELERKIPALLAKYWNQKKADEYKYFIQPLTDIHLHSHLIDEISTNNDIKIIYPFTSIAFLILIIACINYINLATAKSPERGKEVGIRKVVGAQRWQLVTQFVGESLILTFIALIVSIAIIEFLLPAFNSFVERDLSFNVTDNFQLLLWTFLLMAIVGICAGSYPAMAMSSFKPVAVLKGTFKGNPKGILLRNILVVFQFSISVVLIISTLIVKDQLSFMKNKDVGYRKDQIVVFPLKDLEARKSLETIKTELKRNSNILEVSSSSTLPGRLVSQSLASWPGKPEEVEVYIYVGTVDYDFVDLFEIDIVAGRNFSRNFPSDAGGAFLLNEAAVKVIGWETPIGKEFIHRAHHEGRTGKIVGVMKDFHLHSLHQEIAPLYFFLDSSTSHRYLSVKLRAEGISESIDFIRDTMKKFSPKYPFEYSFFDTVFDGAYKSEQKIQEMFGSFALVAIIIACLGLFGLVSFTTLERTKEIGIRRVLGSSVSGIVGLLSREFVQLFFIANIIAWPVAYFVMNLWLQEFAYRIDIRIATFLLAGAVALLIAMLTVSFQAVKAALANLVVALRYE